VNYPQSFPHTYQQLSTVFSTINQIYFVFHSLIRIFAAKMKKLRTIEMNRLSVDEFKQAEKLPLIVVLDDVRSMHNVGSVFRTGDAFRIKAVYLCGITSTPPMAEIHKTALGAEDSVSWKYFPTAMEALQELKTNGYEIYSVEQAHGSTMLQDFQPNTNQKYAVILGNEVKGVHQEVIDASDGCLEIPQFGTKHSMNVSVTAGIIIWHFAQTKLIKI
jgi:tRNA G18 (ribose-2'-O)-methylase SpoU